MKVVLWGINYAPESIGIAPFNRELCEYLAGRGHDVTAVTSFPYYPQWRKAPGDRRQWHRADTAGGVKIHRCWCYVPGRVTTVRRILHELSFGLVSMLHLLAQPRAEVYVVVSPPLVLGLFAWIVTALKRSRFIFHVQDLQPDAAVGLGMIRHGWLVRALYGLERLAYAKAARVSGISGGMMAAFAAKGVPAPRRVLLPNWLRGDAAPRAAGNERAEARRFFGLADETLLAFYAGNLGRKQQLEILVEAAALLQTLPPADAARVRILIAGDGAARPDLEKRLQAHPGAGIELRPLLSERDYTRLLRAADVALITQATGSGRFFFPSKLLSVLAAGLPVVAVAESDSELYAAVRSGGFGRTVPPGDALGLAVLLRSLSECGGLRDVWSERTSWVRQFSREAILPRFEQMLIAVAQEKAGTDPAAHPSALAPGGVPFGNQPMRG